MASSSPARKVLITGASGLLGRAILREFSSLEGFETIGCGFSRIPENGVKVDLRDENETRKLVETVRPFLIIHSAAERRPDACENDPAGSEVLNIHAVYTLGKAAAAVGSHFIYISTDYLFDGTAAPYSETAALKPLNAYGRQKARGEYAALASHPHPFLLRIPVLYGPTADITESAVTTFASFVKNQHEKKVVDDWQIRVPTFTPDIGKTLVNVAQAYVKLASPPAAHQVTEESASSSSSSSTTTTSSQQLPSITLQSLHGIFNYSAPERYTRWGFVQLFGKLLNLPIDHIERDPNPPKGAPRPYDCHLNTAKLVALGLAAPTTPFEEGCKIVLAGGVV